MSDLTLRCFVAWWLVLAIVTCLLATPAAGFVRAAGWALILVVAVLVLLCSAPLLFAVALVEGRRA